MATQKGEAAESGYGADTDQLMSSLADKLGKGARAAAVFGEPVERDGVTIIPVAKARWGMGGGGGHRRHGANEGIGGGGGVTVNPVGYIEIRGNRTRFRSIWDPAKIIALSAIGGLVLVGALRAFQGSRGEQ